MRRHANSLWITAILLGWLLDFLFWKKIPGVSFPIYTLACLVGGFVLLKTAGFKPSRDSLFLLIPIGFFALFTFIRQEPLSLALAFAFTLLCMALLAITFLGGRWLAYSLSDFVVKLFDLLVSMVVRPMTLLMVSDEEPPEAETPKKRRPVWSLVRGLLIAIPVVALFAGLLASADLIFAQRLQGLIDMLRLENLPEYIFRGLYILGAAYALVGVFLHAATRSSDEKLVGEEKPLVAPFLGFTEAAVVLGSVLVLFAAFVVIQFQYFFSGQANIHLEGYTYAEYARRGFGELNLVAFCSLLLFLGLSSITKRLTPNQAKTFSGLGIGLVVMVGVILVSAYQRLLLYEAVYGFSRLRTYSHVFMVWLGLLLAAVVTLEVLRRQRLFALAALLAGLGFAATLNILNVDALIVRQNVDRAVQGQQLDVAYLSSLSTDAAPALAAYFQSADLTEELQDEIGGVLTCLADHANSGADELQAWQSFHLGRWLGKRALGIVRVELEDYRLRGERWDRKVFTPQGNLYDCQP